MRRLLLVAVLVGASACGGDSDAETTDAGPEGGVGPTGGSGGPVMPVDAATPGAVTIICGANTCTQPGAELIPLIEPLLAGFLPGVPLSSILPQPCCAEGDACGTVTPTDGGSECVPVPESDPRCPDTTLLPGLVLVGCCDETMGLCGINLGGTCAAMAGGMSCAGDGGSGDDAGGDGDGG